MKLPILFTPQKLKGSLELSVSKSHLQSLSLTSEAVTEPSTAWTAVCSHTITPKWQAATTAARILHEDQFVLVLTLFASHSCHYLCFSSPSPCYFSQSFQCFQYTVSHVCLEQEQVIITYAYYLNWELANEALPEASSESSCAFFSTQISLSSRQ